MLLVAYRLIYISIYSSFGLDLKAKVFVVERGNHRVTKIES